MYMELYFLPPQDATQSICRTLKFLSVANIDNSVW